MKVPLHLAPQRKRGQLARRLAIGRYRFGRLSPTMQGLLWATVAGIMFTFLNTLARHLATQLPALESQFLRYLMGFFVMLPTIWRAGWAAFWPKQLGGQFLRGIVHTMALALWFTALPKIPLADTTAIGFTTPIFIMLGAWLVFREPMRWERWLAALLGFSGVMVVVGPKLAGEGGYYNLVMLASAPVFAASLLITKALTRQEKPIVIVAWQAITVTILSCPFALLEWQAPTATQWLGFVMCGVLGSTAHYCLTRSFGIADISATQSVKFLDLVWASLMGWLVFSDPLSQSTWVGGLLILASTVWIARRERQLGKY